MTNMSNWGKIAIGARLTRIDPYFFISWTRLVMAGIEKDDCVMTPAVGMPHASAANYLVIEFLKTDCDSILFLDDDGVFDSNALHQLRNSGEGFGVLAGLSVCRRHPYSPVVLVADPESTRPKVVYDLSGIVECDYVGLAFTLVRREVLESVSKLITNEHPFSWENAIGEDGSFCRDAKLCGYKIGVNSDINIGHRVEFSAVWDKQKKQTIMGGHTIE